MVLLWIVCFQKAVAFLWLGIMTIFISSWEEQISKSVISKKLKTENKNKNSFF